MSFWTDLDPFNPRSRFFHPIKERRFRRNKEVEKELGSAGMALLNKRAGQAGFEEAVVEAKAALERRQPRNPNQPLDIADQLLLQARRRQLGSLGIGTSRASTFASVTQPLAPVASLYRS